MTDEEIAYCVAFGATVRPRAATVGRLVRLGLSVQQLEALADKHESEADRLQSHKGGAHPQRVHLDAAKALVEAAEVVRFNEYVARKSVRGEID